MRKRDCRAHAPQNVDETETGRIQPDACDLDAAMRNDRRGSDPIGGAREIAGNRQLSRMRADAAALDLERAVSAR